MIVQIENAMLERLKLAGDAGVLGYKYKTAEAFPQDWDQHLVSAAVNYPAAFVRFISFTGDASWTSGTQVTATFSLVVASIFAGNKTLARQGAKDANGNTIAAKPGSIQLMEDTIALLQGQNLGLEIGGLTLAGGQAPELSDELVKKGVSLMAMQWTTAFSFDLGDPDDTLGSPDSLADFRTFNSNWDVAPHGDDDQPSFDFETTVTLPESA